MPSTSQLLVFAHTPPPVHGQSVMVQVLVDGLPGAAPGLRLFHVNPRLSRDAADVGRWRAGKVVSLLAACARALWLRLRHGPMTLYYVPAPGRRAALYRDWLVMLLCRPWFPRLVLHWHAVGLGDWLASSATAVERAVTLRLLGDADLAIVLAPELSSDAVHLSPRRTVVVPNGLDLPASAAEWKSRPAGEPAAGTGTRLLFIGLCTREKGLFDTLAAVGIANRQSPGSFQLTVAGAFACEADEQTFQAQAAALGAGVIRHLGLVSADQRTTLLAAADVFCLPTVHPHEGQPLALIEALAADLSIVTTRWRAIPGMLPQSHVWLVDPHRPEQLATALQATRLAGRPHGELRAHYLAHFTRDRHLQRFAAALNSLHDDAPRA